MFSVLTKLIPCLALTYLSLALIRVLYRANQRKQRLKQHGYNDYNLGPTSQHLVVTNSQHCDRTTRMLLAILLMFLVTEFPSGLVALLSGILGDDFQLNVYHKLGEIMDLLALVNSAVNFILYCTMSRQFRKTFTKLFCTTVTVETNPVAAQRRRRQSADPFTCNTTCVWADSHSSSVIHHLFQSRPVCSPLSARQRKVMPFLCPSLSLWASLISLTSLTFQPYSADYDRNQNYKKWTLIGLKEIALEKQTIYQMSNYDPIVYTNYCYLFGRLWAIADQTDHHFHRLLVIHFARRTHPRPPSDSKYKPLMAES